MDDSVYISAALAMEESSGRVPVRHTAIVRITHLIGTISFIGLVVSGVGVILAHPRFYWGETGGVGTPSLFDLPLPFMLGGPSGWGRYLHFESAWVCVLNGLVYVASGFAKRHFQDNLTPARKDWSWAELSRELGSHLRFERPVPASALSYNTPQRLSYLAVIFALFPLMVWTGLAMSPAVTSVFPGLVNVFGGHQTARTLHFFGTLVLVAFVLVHIVMVWRSGFWSRVSAMITGSVSGREETGKEML
jgi:thiosulfate reductase cytochrome b subunit